MNASQIFSNLARATAALLIAGTLASCATQTVSPAEPERLVADARTTLSNFVRDPNQTWIQDNLNRAQAVLIAPQITAPGSSLEGPEAARCCWRAMAGFGSDRPSTTSPP